MESGMKNDETIEIHGGRRVHMILLKFFLYSNEVFRLYLSTLSFTFPEKKKWKRSKTIWVRFSPISLISTFEDG